MHFYFLSIFVSLKKPQCGGRCSAEPKLLTTRDFFLLAEKYYILIKNVEFYDKQHLA